MGWWNRRKLVSALEGTDEAQRLQAARELGASGEREAVEPLLAALTTAGNGLRVAVLEALGALRDPRAFAALGAALAVSELRAPAARGLASLGDPRAVEPLRQALRGAPAAQVPALASALQTLGWQASEEERALLAAAENDAVALSQVPEAAYALLLPRLDGEGPTERAQAAELLGRLLEGRALPRLVQLLEDAEPGVQDAAALALVRLGWVPRERNHLGLAAIARGAWREVGTMGADAIELLFDRLATAPLALAGFALDETQRRRQQICDALADAVRTALHVQPELVASEVLVELVRLGDEQLTMALRGVDGELRQATLAPVDFSRLRLLAETELVRRRGG